jgi:proteasome assembly chaperone (PAC2) family protein
LALARFARLLAIAEPVVVALGVVGALGVDALVDDLDAAILANRLSTSFRPRILTRLEPNRWLATVTSCSIT